MTAHDVPHMGLGEHSSAFGERGVLKRLEALNRLTVVSGDRLLDVGCANGEYTLRLADGFSRVDAIDVESQRLEEFRARVAGTAVDTKLTIQKMFAEDLDFDDETFDVATTIEVLEHVTSVPASLSEIFRVLKPGGELLITSPNRFFPIETHGFKVGERSFSPIQGPFLPWVPPLHRRLSQARTFTVPGLTRLLADQGFQRIAYDYIMPPFDRSRLGARVRPALDRIERSSLSFFGMALIVVARKPRRRSR